MIQCRGWVIAVVILLILFIIAIIIAIVAWAQKRNTQLAAAGLASAALTTGVQANPALATQVANAAGLPTAPVITGGRKLGGMRTQQLGVPSKGATYREILGKRS